MALAANISTLTDELIVAVANLEDKKDPSRFKGFKRRVEDSFKSGHYGRTDQFAVAKQLEGLQEKFQVLNKDELADALRSRLNELDEHRSSWFPEILSLLLQLSDRPALLSNLDRIKTLKPSETEKSLAWTDLDPSGTAYSDDDIWEDVDYGAESSDDDVTSVSSGASVPRTLPRSPVVPEEDYVIPDEIFSSGQDEDLIASIKAVQFWKPENNLDPQNGGPVGSITELQVLRETIFMLQGLPTSLFWRHESVEVDRRYALTHSSDNTLSSLLHSFSLIGSKLDELRRFIQVQQSIPYLQTFHRGVEGLLYRFDTALSNMHSKFLSPNVTTPISLIQLIEDIRREAKLPLLLTDLVSGLKKHDHKPIRCLDSLYDMVCMLQATGDDEEFKILAELFFSCFETYTRPIKLWMETGQLDSVDGASFILDKKGSDLRTLWHDWYTLEEGSMLQNAPKFLQPVARKVYTAGKSTVFLKHLEILPEKNQNTTLTFKDLYPQGASSAPLLPFSVLLESAFERVITASHSVTSDLLRKELDQQCGLWMSLQALEYIYLGKDMSVLGAIDKKIFELIDRGRGAWNDRFLLTELARSTFSAVCLIDRSRLIVRSSKVTSRDLELHSRSVKILKALSFDYVLPWPVANIITKDAIRTYQRISMFLMQIRRAKYVIIKQRLQYTAAAELSSTEHSDDALGYAIRHNMLWFLNTLYSHLTDLVISTTTASMQKSLASAKDVDDMISVHRGYMSSLEEQCLFSQNLIPLHQAIISLLDLCVHFADIQSTRHGQNYSDDEYRTSNRYRAAQRTGHSYPSDDDDQTDEEDDSDENFSDPGNTTAISFHESPYAHRLRSVKNQFDRLLAFITVSLKGVVRVDGAVSWEILAEKLEWRKQRLV